MKAWAVLFVGFLAIVLLIGSSYQLPALDASGRTLLHTENVEEGHKHGASCFGFGGGNQGPPPPPNATASG